MSHPLTPDSFCLDCPLIFSGTAWRATSTHSSGCLCGSFLPLPPGPCTGGQGQSVHQRSGLFPAVFTSGQTCCPFSVFKCIVVVKLKSLTPGENFTPRGEGQPDHFPQHQPHRIPDPCFPVGFVLTIGTSGPKEWVEVGTWVVALTQT